MKKTILQYMTDIYQEDIPKHILQENKIRLNSFFLEQESVQKKGTQFIFRYAFYSVEKPRKITKQHLLKEYAGVPLEKRSVQPEQIPDMKQYSDIILYGDASSPEAQQQLAEYGEGSPADVEKEREKLRRLAELIKFQLNPDKFPKVKFSDDVKVPVSTLQLLIKKINEEYVL